MVKLWISRTNYFLGKSIEIKYAVQSIRLNGKSRSPYGENLTLVISQATYRIAIFLGQSIVKSNKQNDKICLGSGLAKIYP